MSKQHDKDKYGTPPEPIKKGDAVLITSDLNTELAKFSKQEDKALGQLNSTERSLCGQLMLINTVLITGSMVILSNTSRLQTFSGLEKGLVVAAFILLAASTLAGVKYYFEIMNVFRKWVDVNHAITYFIATGAYKGYEQMRTHIMKRQEEVTFSNEKRYLFIQIGCMAAALGAYLLLAILIMFGTHTDTNNQFNSRHESGQRHSHHSRAAM